MTESGANTGVFESWDANGSASFTTKPEAAADGQVIFSYGGNSVDMIITYQDAQLTMDAGGDWAPGQTATITLVDSDANKNPTSAETLNAYDETVKIPTIKMGSPLTLATGTNDALEKGDANDNDDATNTGVNVGSTDGGMVHTLAIQNTTDHSERLRIIHSAGDLTTETTTWLNVTTGHTRAEVIALAGTTVLNYDIRGLADVLSTTGIDVYITDNGNNSTNYNDSAILIGGDGSGTGGNAKSGSLDWLEQVQLVLVLLLWLTQM